MSKRKPAKRHAPRIHSSYLYVALDPHRLAKIVAATVKALQPHKHEFDTIAFRGASGSLVGPAVALRLRKHLLLVRREEDRDASHSGLLVEGNLNTERYVIVDDFVSSGNTVAKIIEAIKEHQKQEYDHAKAYTAAEELGTLPPIGSCHLVVCYNDYDLQIRHRNCHGHEIRVLGTRPFAL